MLLLRSKGKVGGGGATSFPIVSPLLVSGASKDAGCCSVSAERGGEVGMDVGDGVGLSGGGSDRGDIGVWVRNVFAEEEDGGVGGLC